MSPTTWYVARSAGIVAYLLLSSSVLLGVLLAGRAKLRWPRFAVQEIHRFLAILTGVFIVLHGASLLLDHVVPFSLAQLLVPFASSYRPFAVGLGVAAAELVAAVGITNALRGRLPYRWWRRAHYLTIPVWVLGTGHALLTGTDRRDSWFVGAVGAVVCAVALAFAARFASQIRPAALATTGAAALASVLALAFAPQPSTAHATAKVTRGVPASFTGTLDAQVVQNDGAPVVSVVGRAGGAGVRVDLLVANGVVQQSELKIAFPSGAACTGTVTALRGDGMTASCGSSNVRISWQIGDDRRVTGDLAVSRSGT